MSASNSPSPTNQVTPSAKELERLAQRGRGSFDEAPFPLLLRACFEHRRSGVLEVRRRRVVKAIMLEDGLPVHCRSNVAQERFGHFLVKIERISKAEFASSLSDSLVQEVPIGTVLLRKGLVTASELLRLLQHCLVAQLCDVFTWSEGDFAFLNEEPEAYAPLKIRVHQLLVTGTTRFTPQSLVDAAVSGLIGTQLALHPDPPTGLDELRLSDPQRRLARALERPQTLAQLNADDAMPLDEMARLVYSLGVAGVIVPAERRLGDPAVSGSSSAPGSAAGETGEAQSGSTDAAAVTRLFLDHRRLDSFDLLRLAEDATRAEIEAAFLDLALRLAPWVHGQTSNDAAGREPVAEQARAVFLAGADAYSELCDTERRQSLVARRKNLREQRDADRKVGPKRIETDLLDPEVQYEKGLKLLEEGNLRPALEHFVFAADCDPQNGTYRAQCARTRFQCSLASGDESLVDLKDAIRIDPECGLAFLYSGEIAVELKRFDEAEELLRRANVLMKPDRRPVEQLKALSALRKGKRGRRK